MSLLPITEVRQQVIAAIRDTGQVVVTAPTGSGKSTQIPQYLLDDLNPGGRILVLQPRRLAARMLATRVASERQQRVGDEVGFITRFERAVGDDTRILYITEGILVRMFHDDPRLPGVSAVIFDEFHERALNADLGLGLIKNHNEMADIPIPLVVMSATLDTRGVLAYLENAIHIESQGRMFPVEMTYTAPKAQEPAWESATRAVRDLARREPDGDILVFMPGAHEIRRTVELVGNLPGSLALKALPLYGNLSPAQQEQVMQPVDGRKVIVATNIAETSLTIQGVRHVVDSGLARINRYDAARGFNSLIVEPISKFSADQRAGRAGREAPGTCTRLWSRHQHDNKPLAADPEIRRIDLTETVLQLKSLGFTRLQAFPWFEAPPDGAIQAGEDLLYRLGATGGKLRTITPLGRELIKFPAHPRLAMLLREAARRGCLQEAAIVAALLSEPPIYALGKNGFKTLASRFGGAERKGILSDFFVLLDAVEFARNARFDRSRCQARGVHGSASRQVLRTADQYLDIARRNRLFVGSDGDPVELVKSIIAAFPDHLARRRDKGTLVCVLADGRHGNLERESALRQSDILVAGEVREIGQGSSSKVILSLASEVRAEWLDELFPDGWETTDEPVWDDRRKVVELVRTTRCLGLVMKETRMPDVSPELASALIADLIIAEKLKLREWNAEVEQWMDRVRWLADTFPEKNLTRYDDDDIACIIHEICAGERSFANIRTKPCLPYVQNALSWNDQQFVREMAPDRLMLPAGRRLRIAYEPGKQPKGSARIQDFYGLDTSPTIAGGRVPLLLEILAPNNRAVQVTDDLAGFWEKLYPEIKPQLSRRYPKHKWI